MEEKNQDKYQEPTEGEPVTLENKPQLENEVSASQEISFPKKEEDLKLEEKKTEEEKPEIAEKKNNETEPVKEAKAEVRPSPAAEVEPPSTPPSSAKAQKQAKQLKDLDRPSQVKTLCSLAFQKGLNFAIEVAKALDNAYVLDEFHDTLVDELYKELVEKGKLKKL